MKDAIPLMKFLARSCGDRGGHCYVVGGAVRNSIMGHPVKDIDVVVDSVALDGWTSGHLAQEVQRAIPVKTSLVTNQYGVAILTVSSDWELEGHPMRGENIEFANARKESYGGAEGKGYKPHMVAPATIREDLERREFTFNTLLWRLSDLGDGPDGAEVLDLLGTGRRDLEERTVRTPRDPDVTFTDDPTRMLRAVKFVARYGFRLSKEVGESIARNAFALENMPWDAVRKIFTDDILHGPNPRESINLMRTLRLMKAVRGMIEKEPGMAAAIGRSVSDLPPPVYFDLLDSGFDIRTPLGFLTVEDRDFVRFHLKVNEEDPAYEPLLVGTLLHPPVNQMRLFSDYPIPMKERGEVVKIARSLVLCDFGLVHDPSRLQAETEAAVSMRYPRCLSGT